MKGDRRILYESEEDFYNLDGSVAMKLTPQSAMDVCQSAADHGLVIARIEGGVWLDPGFESRLDCIWNGADPPIDYERALANNLLAAEFIKAKRGAHNVFILTAPPITGWPHKSKSEKG